MSMKNRLKLLLEERQWSAYKLIKNSKISHQTIYTVVNDPNYVPSMETVAEICETFKCQPNDVVYWVDDRETLKESAA